MSDNPDKDKEPSLLAQTFQLIGQSVSAFKLPNAVELDEAMWGAAANLSMGEYAAMRRLKAERANGERWG